MRGGCGRRLLHLRCLPRERHALPQGPDTDRPALGGVRVDGGGGSDRCGGRCACFGGERLGGTCLRRYLSGYLSLSLSLVLPWCPCSGGFRGERGAGGGRSGLRGLRGHRLTGRHLSGNGRGLLNRRPLSDALPTGLRRTRLCDGTTAAARRRARGVGLGRGVVAGLVVRHGVVASVVGLDVTGPLLDTLAGKLRARRYLRPARDL